MMYFTALASVPSPLLRVTIAIEVRKAILGVLSEQFSAGRTASEQARGKTPIDLHGLHTVLPGESLFIQARSEERIDATARREPERYRSHV